MTKRTDAEILARYEARRQRTRQQIEAAAYRSMLCRTFQGVRSATAHRFHTARRAKRHDADRFLAWLLTIAQKYGEL